MEDTLIEMEDSLQTFGFTWQFFAIQALTALVWLVLLIKGISVTLKKGEGAEVPLWVILQLLFPFIGSVIALVYFRRRD